MSSSEIIRIFKPELKENLNLRQKYYHNTSPNIDKEINSIILLNGHVSEKYNMSTKVFLTSFNFKYILPSSSKAAPSHINNIQFKVLIRSSVQN